MVLVLYWIDIVLFCGCVYNCCWFNLVKDGRICVMYVGEGNKDFLVIFVKNIKLFRGE